MSIMTGVQAGGVTFDRVSKRYGDMAAVDDVSFTIEPGTLVTLLGPSGCGKTTTLRMAAGLETASSGRILIGGEDVTNRAASERNVSLVFQSYALFPHMSVLDNVCYGPISAKVDKARARALAQDKLNMLGLAGLNSACRANCLAGSSSALPSRARWCSNPRCCCSTSRSPTSMPSCAAAFGRRSASCSSHCN